ncbi:SRPBCC family protein [Nocardia sp. CA-120079]|uniref:SRPBCC family protein n=1 Tax=Nocardia sp. CA-120079 TaxID=3239974 RepID=UPI003D958183
MTRWFPLADSDDTLIQNGPIRFRHSVIVPAEPERVWQLLTAADALVSWARGITGVDWITPRPFGIGTRREVTVGRGAAALRERFYRWDENKRLTFTVEAANRPGFRRFAEDITLEPHPDGTHLTWTFAAEAEPWFAALLFPARPLIHRVTRSWTEGITERVKH